MLELVPAYGRDYKSKKALIADLEAPKDFEVATLGAGGRYTSAPELARMGETEVMVRYGRLMKVAVIKLASLKLDHGAAPENLNRGTL